jgi:hypothetical protein
MLTAKQKEDWVAALRSGNYRQTQKGEEGFQRLKGPVGYCCLGVLAELNEWETGHNSCLPQEGAQALSVSADYGYQTVNGALSACGLPEYPESNSDTLAGLNDNGVPFKELADFLEQHLPTKD